MDTQTDKCVCEILNHFNNAKKRKAQFTFERNGIFDRSLYLNENEYAKIYIDNKEHQLLECPLVNENKIYSNDIINKLDTFYNVEKKYENTKYVYGEFNKIYSKWTYYEISDGIISKTIYNFNKFIKDVKEKIIF